MNNPVPAVLTPLDEHMGLDIARSLQERGIPVYGLEHDRSAIGKYSNACQFVLSPNAQKEPYDYLEFLANFAARMNCRPVLYPLSDEHVLVISRHREVLQDHYVIVMPPKETIESLCTKSGLIEVARKLNIPAPATFFPESEDDAEMAAQEVCYPAIIKPCESPQWHDPRIERQLRQGVLAGRAKVVLCKNKSELMDSYHQLARLDPSLIIQEVIPGEDRNLVYVSFYMDRSSRPLAIFAGCKERVIPIGFGSASFVHSMYSDEIVQAGLRIFENTGYQGLGGIEFKKDSRDGIYKLIEVNTRFGMWDGLGRKCGVDTAYIAYCDALGIPCEPCHTFRDGVAWLDWQRDFRAAIAYRRIGKLSWRSWLASLRGEKMWAIYSRRDPLPGIFFTLKMITKFFSRFIAQLAS